MTGSTQSVGREDSDLLLLRIDQTGHELWSRTFGGNQDESGYKIIGTANGDYVVCGVTSSMGNGQQDVWLLRFDSTGNEIWRHAYGGIGNAMQTIVLKTDSQGFIYDE